MMLILIFYILHFQGYVVCSGSATWTSNIPTSVVALGGSCVVIPCTYDHPSNTITAWKPFWFIQSTKGEKTVTVYSNVSKIAERFQNRISMPGNVQEKNCSLQINSVKQDDTPGPYFFRIEIPGFNNYSYNKNPTRITFKAEADPPSLSGVKKKVRAGESVTVSCSVSHSCPPHPPTITWSHNGSITVQSEQQTAGQHQLTSSLTFNAIASDHQQPITCSAQYHGGKKNSTSFNFTVGSATQTEPVTQTPHTSTERNTTTASPVTDDILIKILPATGALCIGIAMLVCCICHRAHKRKHTTQCPKNVYTLSGERPCLEMTDPVYANTEVIKAGTDVGHEDEVYANVEFLQSQDAAVEGNHGFGSFAEPDEDIYANTE